MRSHEDAPRRTSQAPSPWVPASEVVALRGAVDLLTDIVEALMAHTGMDPQVALKAAREARQARRDTARQPTGR